MKIAIVSGVFFDTSIPLVDAFLKQGHTVDFFAVCKHPKMFKNSNMFEFEGDYTCHFMQEVNHKEIRGMRFIETRNLRTFLVCFNYFRSSYWVTKAANALFWPVLLNRLVNFFKQSKYDYVAVIGHYYFLYELSALLNNTSIIHTHSLHEVSNRTTNDGVILDCVFYLLNKNIPIVVHSLNILNHLENSGVDCDNIYSIPFGTSYGITDFNTGEEGILRELNNCRYALSYGYIGQYKGFDLLWHTYKQMKEFGPLSFKIVVAGKGFDPFVEKMKMSEDFIIINRYISNDELATLIYHADVILCHHIAVSQSGIPQSSWAFAKPVIASKIGAFKESIKDNENGHLSELDPISFSHVILDYFADKDMQQKNSGIIIPNSHQWHNIVKDYERMIKNLRNKRKKVKKEYLLAIFVRDILNRLLNRNKII